MNKITIELCAEDRARLDRIAELLEKQTTESDNCSCRCKAESTPEQMSIDVDALTPPTVSAENHTDAQEEPTPITAPAEPEMPTEEKKPTVTLEQIQQKVMQLATANGGAIKGKVRDIISTYGSKVSDLKEQPDKWDEVWAKLTALESEE